MCTFAFAHSDWSCSSSNSLCCSTQDAEGLSVYVLAELMSAVKPFAGSGAQGRRCLSNVRSCTCALQLLLRRVQSRAPWCNDPLLHASDCCAHLYQPGGNPALPPPISDDDDIDVAPVPQTAPSPPSPASQTSQRRGSSQHGSGHMRGTTGHVKARHVA